MELLLACFQFTRDWEKIAEVAMICFLGGDGWVGENPSLLFRFSRQLLYVPALAVLELPGRSGFKLLPAPASQRQGLKDCATTNPSAFCTFTTELHFQQ